MSPRQLHPHLRRILLSALLLCGLSVSAYAAPVGTPTRAAGIRPASHTCRTHAKRHHARGCRTTARRPNGAHKRTSLQGRKGAARHQRSTTQRRGATRHQRIAAHRRAAAHQRVAMPLQPTPQSEAATNAAVIAGILATQCANTEVTPEEGNLQAVTTATLCLVNQERARHGEMPLQLNADLEVAADGHSQEMVSEDYFAHVAPNGLTPLARVQDTGYIPSSEDGYTIGENIAWGTLALSTPRRSWRPG